MEKHRATIFLIGLLIVAFTNAGKLSFQKAGASSSIDSTYNDCFNSNVNEPGIDIERCNISGHIGTRAHQMFKKITGFLSGNNYRLLTSTSLSSSASFVAITSFDNNNLSHNYPSHNFW